MTLPGRQEWLFSVKAFIGAMLAVYVSFLLDLSRPTWAMMTAYIVAQPLAGMVQSKALYRGIGTVVGSALAIVVVTECVNAPELMTLILALWVGLCVHVTVLEKSPRSYMLMLSGYTVVIIAAPSVTAPEAIFDTALSRCEEILLGITCAVLANNLIFPQRVGPVLMARVDAWLTDAARLTTDVLRGKGAGAEADRDFTRLTSDAIALDALRVHAVYDTPALRAAEGAIIALRHRMQTMLPLLVGVKDRLEALEHRDPALFAASRPLLDKVADWIRTPHTDSAATARLQREISDAMPSDEAIRQSWDHLLLRTILARLSQIMDNWGECRALRQDVEQGQSHAGTATIAVHRDHFIAALSGLAAAVAVALTGAFWILSGWPHGSVAMMMAAVGASIFASLDDPGPVVVKFLYLSVPAAIIAGIYEVAIFPAINSFPLLLLVLAPLYLPVGALLAMPAYTPLVMPIILGCTGILSLSNTQAPDFETFVNGAIAQVVGLGAAATVLVLMRRFGADWAAGRLMAATRRDLARIAAGDPKLDRAQFEGRMIDRLAALVPRLAGSNAERRRIMTDAQAGLRMGLNIQILQQIRPALSPEAGRAVASLLRALQRHFSDRLPDSDKIAALAARHDAAIRMLARDAVTPAASEALILLGGMRQSLLSHAQYFETETGMAPRFSDPMAASVP